MATERKKGAKGVARTELVAIRFDPRTRYGLELAARVQRRSVANFIEATIEDAFKRVMIELPGQPHEAVSVDEALLKLWDPEEADRFAILASYFPHLLTFEEQRLWKLIEEVWSLAQPLKGAQAKKRGFRLEVADLELLRTHWTAIKDAADAGMSASETLKIIQGDPVASFFAGIGGQLVREARARGKEASESEGSDA